MCLGEGASPQSSWGWTFKDRPPSGDTCPRGSGLPCCEYLKAKVRGCICSLRPPPSVLCPRSHEGQLCSPFPWRLTGVGGSFLLSSHLLGVPGLLEGAASGVLCG